MTGILDTVQAEIDLLEQRLSKLHQIRELALTLDHAVVENNDVGAPTMPLLPPKRHQQRPTPAAVKPKLKLEDVLQPLERLIRERGGGHDG